MSKLTLSFLGAPEVHWQQQVLSFPTRKALALLIYLVVAEGRQSRDHLAALLWPESDSARARATLRNGLHQLRTTLPNDSFLHVERDALAFNNDASFTLDLHTVARALPLDAPPRVLETAVAAYRGDFLTGFTLGDAPGFDDWAAVQRELWHRRLDDIFERLSQMQFEAGQLRPSLDTTTRWLAHNPLNEAAYCRLMRLHQAGGDRAAALQAYDACRATLAEELGVAPGPETKALAAQIDAAGTAVDDAPACTTPQTSGAELKFSEGPLVGRAEEFAALVARYHAAAAGQPQVATIVGEAGIGKTRLAADFLAWAAAQGADVVRGRSFESGRQLPYQPLVDGLRPRVEAINAPEDYLSDTWLAELSRLLPELLDRYPDLQPARLDETAARTRLFEAVARLTSALAVRTPADAPLILFLDDVQWADDASLDVVQYLCRRWQESEAPVLLLLTARAEVLRPLSAAHAPRLAERLPGLARQVPAVTLDLAPLTAADIGQLVADLGGDDADPFVGWLFEETSGQPFYLVATLEALREQDLVAVNVDAAGKWQLRTAVPEQNSHAPAANLPEKVRQVIVSRLARLTPPAFDLLAASAVLARDFTFERLCQIADMAEGQGLRALDELLRSQLLHESEETYLFAHDKIRDVVYAEAGEARRRIFHRRALAALAGSDAAAAQLARHALAVGDHDAAFNHSLAAGDEALSLFAARNAITHYEQARTVSKQLTVSNVQLRPLYMQLGRAHELVGDYGTALVVYDELQQIAQQRADEPLELAALMASTTVYAAPTQHYDPEHVAVLTEQALPLAQKLADHAAEAKIQWNLMLLRLFTGDIAEAVAAGEASLAIARKHDLREREAYALHDLTRAYLFSGRPEEGLASGEEAQQLWRALDNKAMLADNLVSTSSAMFFWQGNYAEIIPRLHEALALSEKIDNLWNQSYANHILGFVHFELGHFSRAIAACERSVTYGLEAGFMVPLFANGSGLAWMYSLMGTPERGWPWLEKALQEDSVMRDQQAAPQAVKAYLHLHRGELAQANEAIQKSYDNLELHALSAAAFFTFPIDGRLQLAQAKYDQALAVSERFIDYLSRTRLRPFRADALYIKGQALLALGQTEAGWAALKAARQHAEELNSRRVLWEILAAQAGAAEMMGEKETAVALRQQAQETIDYIAGHIDEPDLRGGFLAETLI